MFYICHSLKFEKESQSLKTNLHNKQIREHRKILNQLTKTDQLITEDLHKKEKRNQCEKNRQNQEQEKLEQLKDRIARKVFKLENYKNQIEALKNPQLIHDKANVIKKYLITFHEQKHLQRAIFFKGFQRLELFEIFVISLQLKMLVKPKKKQLVKISKTKLWDEVYEYFDIMITVRKCQNLKKSRKQKQIKYLLEVYTLTIKKPYLFLKRYCTIEQVESIDVKNPLQNLIILFPKKQIYFLDEYIDKKRPLLVMSLKKYKLKMVFQKQRRKMIFFKRFKLTHIFESIYRVTDYLDLEIDVLMIVKHNTPQSFSMKNFEEPPPKYILTLENICSVPEIYSFKIQDKEILEQNPQLLNDIDNLDEAFFKKFMFQYQGKPKEKKKMLETMHFDGEQDRFSRFVQILDFQKNIKKILFIQSYYRKKKPRAEYLSLLKKKQKPFYYVYNNNKENPIFICLLNTNKQYFSIVIQYIGKQHLFQSVIQVKYAKKYEKIASNLIQNDKTIIEGQILNEVEGQVKRKMEKEIKKYEEQVAIINLLKPRKAFDRLKRFFVNIFLRLKVKRNIPFIKKIKMKFGTLVLIIKKIPILKGFYHIFLYPLNTPENVRYKKITLSTELVNYLLKYKNKCEFRKLEEEFYISEKHFLLKPYISQSFTYIHRLSSIKISSEEIQKQINLNKEQDLPPGSSHFLSTKNKNKTSVGYSIMVSQQKPEFLQLSPNYENEDAEVFFTLYKNEQQLFFISLFLVQDTKEGQFLRKVHNQQLNKRQMIEGNGNFIYSIIATWFRESEEFSEYKRLKLQQKSMHLRNTKREEEPASFSFRSSDPR